MIQQKVRRLVPHRSNANLNITGRISEIPAPGIHLLKDIRRYKGLQLPRRPLPNYHIRRVHSKQPVQHKAQKLSPEETAVSPIKTFGVMPFAPMTDTPATDYGAAAGLRALTRHTIVEHLDDVVRDICAGERSVRNANCLKNHSVSPLLRAKMINWMIEVLGIYECYNETLFLAVGILDAYFSTSPKYGPLLPASYRPLRDDDVHLAGIVSMFIASKYEDCDPLNMKVIIEEVGHGDFAPASIKAKEQEILCSIGFNITFPTVWTFAQTYIEIFSYMHAVELTSKDLETLKRVRCTCLYTAKMTLYDYEFLKYSPSLLAKAVIYHAILNESVEAHKLVFVEWMKELVTKDPRSSSIETCSRQLGELRNTFARKFEGMTNLQAFETAFS